jgi:hypothetical protein
LPWTLVGVVALALASIPLNSLSKPLMVVVPLPSAPLKPMTLPVTVNAPVELFRVMPA